MGENKNKAHKALYRKYRTRSLDEMVGQEHITKTLANAIKQGRISHAYLFTGPRGTGKTSIARILAHEINDLPYTDDAPHLDIIEIDAASNRRIDDIRDLRDKVNIAPISLKYKVYIIDEVHMLTTESFNALLKTLEEPPEHVVFILATTEVHKLPATILSRTQRHTFKLYPEDQIAAHLKKIAKKENIDIDNEAIQLLARHGNGSFRDSISLLDQLSSQESKVTAETVELLLGVAQSSQLVNLTNAMQNGDTAAVMNGVGTLLDSGLTPSGIASQLAIHIRDQIVAGNNTALVSLLGDLLTVHGSANQQLTLESILLRATVGQLPQSPAKATSASSITSPQKTAKVSQVTAKSQKKAPSENSSSNPQAQSTTTSPLPSDFVIDEAWPKILAAVEAQNKPLYTVLRLAHPSVNKGKLAIAFAFEFHQKRVDDAKHKAIIASCLSQVTGHSAGVETVLDKSLGTPDTVILQQSSPQPDPAHASVIAGIQDIMGGGEVVNV